MRICGIPSTYSCRSRSASVFASSCFMISRFWIFMDSSWTATATTTMAADASPIFQFRKKDRSNARGIVTQDAATDGIRLESSTSAWMQSSTRAATISLISLRLKKEYLRPEKRYVVSLVRLGLPSGVTQAIFSMSMIIVQSLTNSFGEQFIAANVIVMRIDGFVMLPAFSLGTAMTTFAGQNIGAGKMDRVLQGARQGTLTAMGVSAVVTALILLFGRSLMGVFTETPELIDLSYRMMQILAVGYIAMEVTQCLSGIMRGAGDTVTPMWIAIINTVIVRVPLAYGLVALSKTPELPQGNCAMMYVSLLVTWIIGATITFVLYRTGRWKRKANIVVA